MAISVKQKNKGILQLAIQEEMTIYNAEQQKKSLYQHLLNARQEMQLDLADVEEIDSAGLQLLLFLKREAKEHAIKFTLIHHSQAVVDVLELLNLVKYFGDPIVLSADWKKT